MVSPEFSLVLFGVIKGAQAAGAFNIEALRSGLQDWIASYGAGRATLSIAAGSTKAELDALPGGVGKTGPIKEVPDEAALKDLLDKLSQGGKTVDPGTYPGVVKELPDGTIVRSRQASKSGGPTLDITLPGGAIYKVHVK